MGDIDMSRDNMDVLVLVKEKIQQSGVRLGTIIAKCEEVDRNNDDVIHTDDLEVTHHSHPRVSH